MSRHTQRAQSAYAAGVQVGKRMFKELGDIDPARFNKIYRQRYLPANPTLPSIRFMGARNSYINARAAKVDFVTNKQLDTHLTGGK